LIFSYSTKSQKAIHQSITHYERLMKRRELKFQLDTDSKCTASQKGIQQEDDNDDITEQQVDSTEQYEGESNVDLS